MTTDLTPPTRAVAAPAETHGEVILALALAPNFLLLAAQCDVASLKKLSVRTGGRKDPRVAVQSVACHAGAERGFDAVIAVCSPAPLPEGLSISDGAKTPVLGPLATRELTSTLPEFVRQGIGALDPVARRDIIELAARCYGAMGQIDSTTARRLHELREAIRERLPGAVAQPDTPYGLHLDSVVAADERGAYLQGWLRSSLAPGARLTAVSPEGEHVEIGHSLFEYRRPDVEKFYANSEAGHQAGFIAFVPLKSPSTVTTGWVLEMEDASGSVCEARAPNVTGDPLDGRRLILDGLPLDALPAEHLMASHVHPAMQRIQDRLRQTVQVATTRDYGRVPSHADVSIIVPLYGRVDLVEHQLAQFVHDPVIREAQLVYVLDSPELSGELRRRASQLSVLYRIPFRVVELAQNSGFTAANEAGVLHSDSRLLLFLNSDVFPCEPGWLPAMVAFHDATDRIGALGPKLIYEDDSLQHAGMYFHLPDDTPLAGLWANLHYYKGLHRRLPAACVNRIVPAVTGACMLIDRELYHEAGGFSDEYVQGDHEDSDLCLRVASIGRQNWYLADVELYHLEGQSYPDDIRNRAALYNRWLHSHLWDSRLRDRQPEPDA